MLILKLTFLDIFELKPKPCNLLSHAMELVIIFLKTCSIQKGETYVWLRIIPSVSD